jgi:molecular chaperone GrpE
MTDDPQVSIPDVESESEAIPLDDLQAPGPELPEITTPEFEAHPLPAPGMSESGDELLQALAALGDRLDKRLAELQGSFEREVRAETTREKMIDRLHAELQDAKQDLLLNALRPVFIDLIQLHDDIGKVAICPEDGDETVRRLVSLMHGFQQGVEDILYRQGVEPFVNEGDAFDPRRQRAISTVPTEDPSLNKSIATRLRKGFQSRDKVIRPEIVSVFATKK